MEIAKTRAEQQPTETGEEKVLVMQIVTEILEIIVSWPAVAIVIVFVFRKPILSFLYQFAGSRRAKAKVGVTQGMAIQKCSLGYQLVFLLTVVNVVSLILGQKTRF